ncbi:helix-turn-helix domain-containing protein [Labrenzia sp. ac12]
MTNKCESGPRTNPHQSKPTDEAVRAGRHLTASASARFVTNDTEKLAFQIAEAAKIVGVSRSKLYGEIQQRRLKTRKVGHRTFILKTDLLAWLNELPSGQGGR